MGSALSVTDTVQSATSIPGVAVAVQVSTSPGSSWVECPSYARLRQILGMTKVWVVTVLVPCASARAVKV